MNTHNFDRFTYAVLYVCVHQLSQTLQSTWNDSATAKAEGITGAYHVQLFKSSSCECLREVVAIEERLHFNSGLMLGAERSLCLLHLPPQLLYSSVVLANIFTSFLLVQLDKVLHYPLVKVLSTWRMGLGQQQLILMFYQHSTNGNRHSELSQHAKTDPLKMPNKMFADSYQFICVLMFLYISPLVCAPPHPVCV